MRSYLVFAIAAFMLLSMAGASYVSILEPYNATISGANGSIYLGKVGPGQTFTVTISSTTTNSSGTLLNYAWNEFNVSDLPQGWIAKNSGLYRQTLSVEVTPSSNARNGTYSFMLTAINIGNYSKVGSVSFKAYVNVTPDVFHLQVSPKSVASGVGSPTNIYITINNTGVSDSPFVINVSGLPAWSVAPQAVIALHHTTGTFIYPIYQYTPGVYKADVHVSSLESPLVYKSENVTLTVRASLSSDYKAIGMGSVTFPIVYEPAYAVMYLISLIFGNAK
ncbi:hypothetical protein M1329_02205 [Candidatus Marsarchaeota archaeon]|jgi:hypothetical protein|nr:hypothetical protein [Candidatus Marsarchaeota archaeon]MCL5100171.1 hypothetical protein [Candidatus Marsarchaeota archaeon]